MSIDQSESGEVYPAPVYFSMVIFLFFFVCWPGEKMKTSSLWISILFAVGALLASSAPLAKDTGYIFVSSEKDNVVTVLEGKAYGLVKKIETSERTRHMQFNPDRT